MNITWRRHYQLVILMIFLMAGLFYFGPFRLISYNFGEGKEIETTQAVDYKNLLDIFDATMLHEVKIEMVNDDYEKMLSTYKKIGKKEFFKATVTIDGVTLKNVGIRLKGNLTLRQSLGVDNAGRAGGAAGANAFPQRGEGQNFNAQRLARHGQMPNVVFPVDKNAMMQEMADPFDGRAKMVEESNPPFLLKFDEYVDGQTYQGYAEIAVRIGSDKSLLSETVALAIHEELGQIVPQAVYAYVEVTGQKGSLYVLCEHPDVNYVKKHFANVKGILYKAGNFTGFEYLGEDPTLYAEKFEQKTRINKDDLSPLIKFMKFVSQSSNEEFVAELGNYLDLESFVRMMALDNLLDNNDSFGGMGSNYYLFYKKENKQFTMLSWDLNLAMGGMGGGMQRPIAETSEKLPMDFVFPDEGLARDNIENMNNVNAEQRQAIMEEWLAEGGFGAEREEGMAGRMSGNNVLKDRFFANEIFAQMYNDEYNRLKNIIYDQGLATEKLTLFAETFTSYNAVKQIMEQSEYDSGVKKMKLYIEQESVRTVDNPAEAAKNGMGRNFRDKKRG